MDKIGADFYKSVEMIKTRLGAEPLVIQLPIGAESDFAGVVDLVRMKAIIWDAETLGAAFHEEEIPEDLKAKAQEFREKLIEGAVEQDDAAMEAYLEGNEPDIATLKKCIRKGTISGAFFPVICGSAFKNKGVQPMLDAVIDYLPSPVEVPPTRSNHSQRSTRGT